MVRTWNWALLIGIVAFAGYGVWTYTRLPDQPRAVMQASYGAPSTGAPEHLRIDEAVAQAAGRSELIVTLWPS